MGAGHQCAFKSPGSSNRQRGLGTTSLTCVRARARAQLPGCIWDGLVLPCAPPALPIPSPTPSRCPQEDILQSAYHPMWGAPLPA